MSRPAKRRGTGAETAVVAYLRDHGFPHAERRALNGNHDRGDIGGIPAACIEVKNCARVELAEWLGEVTDETANAGAAWGVVWHKRRGKGSPADWYVTMTGHTFTSLLHAATSSQETP